MPTGAQAARPTAGAARCPSAPVALALCMAVFGSACALDLDALRADAAMDAGELSVADAGPAGSGACGALGEACCAPDRTCDVGACLRGRCAAFGGTSTTVVGCTASACGLANPYTQACDCPRGFSATNPVDLAGTCPDGAPGATRLTACVAPRTLDTAWGGLWLALDVDGVCGNAGRCAVPNPYTQRCACGDLDSALMATVRLPTPGCDGQQATLALCMHAGGAAPRFAGAFARGADDPTVCLTDNPLTGSCTCPDGAATQTLAVAGAVLVVCAR